MSVYDLTRRKITETRETKTGFIVLEAGKTEPVYIKVAKNNLGKLLVELIRTGEDTLTKQYNKLVVEEIIKNT